MIHIKHSRTIIIADLHLKIDQTSAVFLEFIRSIAPMQYNLIFLGDLFEAWCAFSKSHTPAIRAVLQAIQDFRQRGGQVIFVVGNKDLAFGYGTRVVQHKLPFDQIVLDSAICQTTSGRCVLLTHGDLVNTDDVQHLRWRAFTRHKFTYMFVRYLVPGFVLGYLLRKNELSRAMNTRYKRGLVFPRGHWYKYLEAAKKKCDYDLCIMGHFHPQAPIVHKNKNGDTIGLVLNDWESDTSYFEFDAELRWQHKQFCSKPIGIA